MRSVVLLLLVSVTLVVPFCNCRAKPIVSPTYRNKLRKSLETREAIPDDVFVVDPGSSGEDRDIQGVGCVLDLSRMAYELETLGRECLDVIEFDDCCQPRFLQLSKSGIYPIRGTRMAYCDMQTDGGGWTVIQRRTGMRAGRKQRSFAKNWRQYKRGFGAVDRNSFWLGLDAIHPLTSVPSGVELRIELEFFNGTKVVAHYDTFHVASESDNYRLTIGDFDSKISTVPDSMSPHNGFQFSTHDNNNHRFYSNGVLLNCAQDLGGAWWYGGWGCGTAILNNNYYDLETGELRGLPWAQNYQYHTVPDTNVELPRSGESYFFTASEMKIRPKTWHCGKYLNYDPELIQHRFLFRNYPDFLEEDMEEIVTTPETKKTEPTTTSWTTSSDNVVSTTSTKQVENGPTTPWPTLTPDGAPAPPGWDGNWNWPLEWKKKK